MRERWGYLGKISYHSLKYPTSPKKLCTLVIAVRRTHLVTTFTFVGSIKTPSFDTMCPKNESTIVKILTWRTWYTTYFPTRSPGLSRDVPCVLNPFSNTLGCCLRTRWQMCWMTPWILDSLTPCIRRGIGESKQHNQKFIVVVAHSKCCLRHIFSILIWW